MGVMGDVLNELETTGILPRVQAEPAVPGVLEEHAIASLIPNVPEASAMEASAAEGVSVASGSAAGSAGVAATVLGELTTRAMQLDQREETIRRRERELAEQRRILAEEYRLLRSAATVSAPVPPTSVAGIADRAPDRFTPVPEDGLWARFKRVLSGAVSPAVREN
jgi:hypothetical protein